MAFSITSGSNKHPTVFKFHDINIYDNKDAFPRSFLVNKFQIVREGKAFEFLAKNPNFDLRHEVILEEPLPDLWATQLKTSDPNDSNTKILSLSANKVIINTDSNSSSLLVLTDAYYSGWHAFVDGKETHIYRGDGLVRTVLIPAGNHTIEFSYMPKSFVIGLSVSLTTAGFLFALFVYSKRKKTMIESTT